MLDWDNLRFFLAVARHGNLSAAAYEMKVAASTISRRLASLEASLGVRLLNRTPEGYVLTLAGEEVRERTERLEAETLCLQRSVGNRDEQLTGLVRITCAESVASHVLAPCLPGLHLQFPSIMIELIPDVRHLSLSMREADIAVRLSVPEHHDVVGRRIGSMAFAVFASTKYIAEHGSPDFDNGCPGHKVVHQFGDMQDAAQTDWFSKLTSKALSALRTCSHEAALATVAANGGIACLARYRATQDYRLMELHTPSRPPDASLWLVLHKDNRRTPRMRAVTDHIVQHARTYLF